MQRQMPLRNALLEFLILLHYRDHIDIRDEIEWSKYKWTVENAKTWTVLKDIKWWWSNGPKVDCPRGCKLKGSKIHKVNGSNDRK